MYSQGKVLSREEYVAKETNCQGKKEPISLSNAQSRVFHGSPLKHAKLPIGAAWTVKQSTTCMDRTNIGRTSKEVSVLRKRCYDDGSQQTWCEFFWQKFQQSVTFNNFQAK